MTNDRYLTFKMRNPEDYIESLKLPMKKYLKLISIVPLEGGMYLVILENTNFKFEG